MSVTAFAVQRILLSSSDSGLLHLIMVCDTYFLKFSLVSFLQVTAVVLLFLVFHISVVIFCQEW